MLLFICIDQRSRNHSNRSSERLEIACVQCEKKRRVIFFGKSGVKHDGGFLNVSLPKCINHLQNFAYERQDFQPKENVNQDSSLINWITKFLYKYLRNNDLSGSCLKCQQRMLKHLQDLHHTDSSHFEYIYEHIFLIHSKRLQCRNPDFESQRLKFMPISKSKTRQLKTFRHIVKLKSDVTNDALAIKHESRKKFKITGNNRTFSTFKSSNDNPLQKLFGYFSSKGKSIIFLPFRHLICSKDTEEENQGSYSGKDKLHLPLVQSNEFVNASMYDTTSTVNSAEAKPDVDFTSFYKDAVHESVIEQISPSNQDTILKSDTSSKEILANIDGTNISFTATSSMKSSDFEITSFIQNTLEKSTVEQTSPSIQDAILKSDIRSNEVPGYMHELESSSTAASSEKRSDIDMASFIQNILKEATVEHTSSSIQDAILKSDITSTEVPGYIHELEISSTAASSEKKSDIDTASFIQNILKEATVEHTSSSIQDAMLKSDTGSSGVPGYIHELEISSTAASSGKKSDIEGIVFYQDTLEESTVGHKPSSIFKSDTSSKEVLASLEKSGFEPTSSTQNTLKESIVEQTPSPMQDAVFKSYFRKEDILALNSYSAPYTSVEEFSEAKASKIYSYVHEAHSRSDSIEDMSGLFSQEVEGRKTQIPDHSHAINSLAAKKFSNALLKSSYPSNMENFAEDPANGLRIEALQKATPLLETVETTALKSTLLSDLSNKLEVSLQENTGIVTTSSEVKEQVEDLETETHGITVDDNFEQSTVIIETSVTQKNFLSFVKSRIAHAELKGKSTLGEGFEISPSYNMNSAALTEVENDQKLQMNPMKQNRLLSSFNILEKPLSKMETKEDSLDSAREISVQKMSESRFSLSSHDKMTFTTHGISQSRTHSEYRSGVFVLSSTDIKYDSLFLLNNVAAKKSDIEASITYSQTYNLPKDIPIDMGRKKARDQQFVEAGGSYKFSESEQEDKQWKKEDLEGEIVAEKLSADIEISADEKTLRKSNEIHEKEIVRASENTESVVIGNRKVEINSDKLKTSETILLSQIDKHLRRNVTLTELEIQPTTSITMNTISVDLSFGQENEKAAHSEQKADEFGKDSSKLYPVEHKTFDDIFGFEDSYNRSLVAPGLNRKEIEEGRFAEQLVFPVLSTVFIQVLDHHTRCWNLKCLFKGT